MIKTEKIDENSERITNNGDAVMSIYDYRGTPYEEQIVLKPGESAVIHHKYIEKPEEKKTEEKETERNERIEISKAERKAFFKKKK